MYSLSRGAPALKSLDLTGCVGVTDAGVVHLSPVLSRLEELRLEGLRGVSDDGLGLLFAAAPSPGVPPEEASASRSTRPRPRLRVISIAGCVQVGDEGLRSVTESALAAEVSELDISGTAVGDRGLRLAAGLGGEGGLRRLRRISLPARGRGVGAPGLEAITSMRKLASLDLEGCNGFGVTSEALAGKGGERGSLPCSRPSGVAVSGEGSGYGVVVMTLAWCLDGHRSVVRQLCWMGRWLCHLPGSTVNDGVWLVCGSWYGCRDVRLAWFVSQVNRRSLGCFVSCALSSQPTKCVFLCVVGGGGVLVIHGSDRANGAPLGDEGLGVCGKASQGNASGVLWRSTPVVFAVCLASSNRLVNTVIHESK